MAKKNTSKNRKAVKTAKKLHKNNPKIFYALVAVIVIAAIAVGVTYFIHPEWFVGEKNQVSVQNELVPPVDGELSIYFLDIGQGDCIYIAFPDGKDMIIDCGSDKNRSSYKDSVLTDLDILIDDNTIDYLMLTHGDTDHVSYLDEVLDNYIVKNIYMPNILARPADSDLLTKINALPDDKLNLFTDEDTLDTKVYAEFFIAAMTEEDANIYLNIGNFKIDGEGYSFDFWCYTSEMWQDTDLSSAEEKNAISPIGILTYAERKIVFTGDSNEINEKKFINANVPVDCDVLKVGHHGSATSSTEDFLNFINCETAIISVGVGNSHGHPTESALQRFKSERMSVYRTDINGNITLIIKNDGNMNYKFEKAAA